MLMQLAVNGRFLQKNRRVCELRPSKGLQSAFYAAFLRNMNRFCALFFWMVCFGLPAAVFPQSNTADSLRALIAGGAPDVAQVDRLTEYAWEINETQSEEAAQKLREAIDLARQLQYTKGEAAAWNGLGVVEEIRGNYAEAQQYYRRGLELRRALGNAAEVGASLNNLGVLQELTGRFDSALVYHRENLRIQEQLHDTVRMARAQFNLAGAFMEMGLYSDAQKYLTDARRILEARNDLDGTAKVYTQLGHLRLELDLYAEARTYYARALELRRSLADEGRLADALNDYANALDELDSSKVALPYYMQALEIRKRLDDRAGVAAVQINLGDAHKHLGNYAQALDYLRAAEKTCLELDDTQSLMEVFNIVGDVHYRAGRQAQALDFVQKYYALAAAGGDKKYIQSAYKDFAEVYAAMGDFAQAYQWRVKYDEHRYAQLNEKISSEFARKEEFFADWRRQEQIDRQQQELRIRDAELAESRIRQFALLGGGAALLMLVGLLFNRGRIRARANRVLAAKNEAIAYERERADSLLKNILPEKTAEELKTRNAVKPVRYESVTVMFTDFVDFTHTAERLSPEDLIGELDACFRLFDAIVEQNGLEKIKTIGDAYMCAGGLPTSNDTHAQDVVRAAVEMQRQLKALMAEKKTLGQAVFTMRVGIHTGPVVAGVVGSRKFAYDIWGDTVNTAARLEQGSEPGKINISETTYHAIKDRFRCTFRGKLAAKNKGEIAMYYVDSDQNKERADHNLG
jgi:adenylate cyclase